MYSIDMITFYASVMLYRYVCSARTRDYKTRKKIQGYTMKSVAYESRAVVGKRQPTLTSKKKNGQESGDTIDMNKLKRMRSMALVPQANRRRLVCPL